MFRKNDAHEQMGLFDNCGTMNRRNLERLEKSWAAFYYEHVFVQIDEGPFAVLYCLDNGRPNFPVNILLSLEFIKHLKGWTDEELLEQFRFNYLVNYALGQRTLGELYLGDRTLYQFRERVYRYTLEHPGEDDLIFGQFEKLTEYFLKAAGLSQEEQRMDSTQIMPNIKRAGRLSLGYDVLSQAVKACTSEILPESLKRVLEPDFKKEVLYRLKSHEVTGRLEELLNLGAELLEFSKTHGLESMEAMCLLDRWLKEQATYDSEQKTWKAKENKDIAADSLQSAYDPDATYRKKGSHGQSGYVVNIAETCSDENPVQIITDYKVEPNSADDAHMLKDRLPVMGSQGVTDLYVDGGYYSSDVELEAQDAGINIHYTNMTGSKPSPEKISVAEFTIVDNEIIEACPEGHPAEKSRFKEKNHMLIAHFDISTCRQCALRDACPVKFQKDVAVLRVSQKAVLAAKTRARISISAERRETTSKRAGIEGTNSVLKRKHEAGRLRVRGVIKSRLATGMKIISHNFNQMVRFFRGVVRNPRKAAYDTT